MHQTEIHLAPGVPDIGALWATSFEDLMGLGGTLVGEQRGCVVRETPRQKVLRLPLPGTSDDGARPGEAPRGAGTGWIFLTRYGAGRLAECLAARLSQPRSSSFAARQWNLLCHLRKHGVGTPELLAMGEVTRPLFSKRSFLVTRALDSMQPLPEWLARHPAPLARRRAGRAIGLTLARIHSAGVHLPNLKATHLFLASASVAESPVEGDSLQGDALQGDALQGNTCAAQQIAARLPKKSAHPGKFRRLPEVSLASARGARIDSALSPSTQLDSLRQLFISLEAALQPSPREAYGVFLLALGRRLSRPERRRLWNQLTSSGAMKLTP